MKDDNCDPKEKINNLKFGTHRFVLKFLNDAIRAEDLMYKKPMVSHIHDVKHLEHHTKKPKQIMDFKTANEIINFRNKYFPFGFRHLNELYKLEKLIDNIWNSLISSHNESVMGLWEDFPENIPRRGPGRYDGIVHAVLLKTGKVLFITADEITLLWDPENSNVNTFDDPTNQPHTMPQ